MKQRITTLSNGITPKGSRPPFTRRYSPAEALAWWTAHRYDSLGMALVASMTPLQIAQLDSWLSQAQNHPSQQAGQVPQAAPATPKPTAPSWEFKQAFGQERRIEGPPVGGEVA